MTADAGEESRAPICAWCGVTTLPSGDVFVCANEDCPGFGEPVG